MLVSQYEYLVDTAMSGDIENKLIAIKTSNGTRLDCLVEDQFEKKFTRSRYTVEEDRVNEILHLLDKDNTKIRYSLPIENIELMSYISNFIPTITTVNTAAITTTSVAGDEVITYSATSNNGNQDDIVVTLGGVDASYVELDTVNSQVILSSAGEAAISGGTVADFTFELTATENDLVVTESYTITVG